MTRRWLASHSLARLALPPLAGRRRGVSSRPGASCIVHRRSSHRIGGFGSACLLLRVRFNCVTAKSSEQCVSMREIGSCPRHAQQPSNASVESRALTSLSFCCTRRVCMASGVSSRLRFACEPLRQRRDIDWRPDGDRMESSAPSMMMLMRCRQRGTARLRRLATGRHAPRARGTPGVPKTRLCSKEGEKRRACIFLRAPAVLKGSDVRDKPPAQVYSDFWRVE